MRESTHVKLHWFSNFLKERNSQGSRTLFVIIFHLLPRPAEVWEVARYTSAAPFYFRAKDNYVDGGLLASNPSLHGLTTIQDHLRREGRGTGVSLLVSVGAGMNPPKAYKNLEITNGVQYLLRNVRFLKFMGNVVSVHCTPHRFLWTFHVRYPLW
jgi:patatin-like phospholipase/acyl hydrolase